MLEGHGNIEIELDEIHEHLNKAFLLNSGVYILKVEIDNKSYSTLFVKL